MSTPISPASISEEPLHPVDRLRRRAQQLSGIDYKTAHAIDDTNLAEIIGEYHMTQLVTIFFNKVYRDANPEFRALFTSGQSPKEMMIQNYSDFLMQRFGGPNYYADRRGTPNLMTRHAYTHMNKYFVERWLEIMEAAIKEMSEYINVDNKDIMMNYFKFTCYYMVAAQEAQEVCAAMAGEDSLSANLRIKSSIL